MKKKNDDLLRLAFGELSAEEARAIEARAEADPSARRELQTCRDIRASLAHLPPPPPDNLSAERLRAAILDRELSAKKPALGWNWAPLAFVAAAAVVFIARPAPRTTPSIVALNEHVGDDLVRHAPLTPPSVADFSVSKLPATVVKPTGNPAPVSATPARFRSQARRTAETVAARTSWVPSPLFKPRAEVDGAKFALNYDSAAPQPEDISSPPSSVSPDSSVATKAKEKESSSDTVVIVSGKRDLDTGAAAATETEANRVLVGG